jgi:hypothetical protein
MPPAAAMPVQYRTVVIGTCDPFHRFVRFLPGLLQICGGPICLPRRAKKAKELGLME